MRTSLEHAGGNETHWHAKFKHQHFRLCVFAPYAGHVVGTGFFGVDIGHEVKLDKIVNRLWVNEKR